MDTITYWIRVNCVWMKTTTSRAVWAATPHASTISHCARAAALCTALLVPGVILPIPPIPPNLSILPIPPILPYSNPLPTYISPLPINSGNGLGGLPYYAGPNFSGLGNFVNTNPLPPLSVNPNAPLPVPEPPALLIWFIALVTLLLLKRRNNQKRKPK